MEGSGQRTLCSDSGVLRLQLNTLSDGTGLCAPHRCGTGQRLNQQLRVNDPGGEASPLEGAVHQAQEPREFPGVRWPQVTQLGAASTSTRPVTSTHPTSSGASVCHALAQGQAHNCSGRRAATCQVHRMWRGISRPASPDEIAIGHAIGRGLFVEICHLLLVQFVHVHLHVYTKRKAVRDQS